MNYANKNLQKVYFNNFEMNFGTRFKEVLRKRNITQRKFSTDTNTHPGLVSRYINGERPSGDFIFKVISYFPEETLYLFFGSSNSTKVEEPASNYSKNPKDIIKDIENKLQDLRQVLPQK